MTYEECVQKILIHQVDDLIRQLKIPKEVAQAVGSLWFKYLELLHRETTWSKRKTKRKPKKVRIF